MSQTIERIETIYKAISELSKLEQNDEIVKTIARLRSILIHLEKKAQKEYCVWDRIQLARHIDRPRAQYYIDRIVEDFIEIHGDRSFSDDRAIIGGIGKIGKHTVTIIAQNKGNNAKENVERNFGMPHPEGYRKALRLMKQAEKFNRPVVCLIDTPGAYCGIGAEERGQGEAIARNIMEMSRLKVPIISGIIGEGGSGGALALGVADRFFMQENTTYSILSPEGFASILWKDSKRAEEAAEKMRMTAKDLLGFEIIDHIIGEPTGGAHKDPQQAAHKVKKYLIEQLDILETKNIEKLVQLRYERFRKYGEFGMAT
ncbi:MAG: acetyl-CoA carboxylase carboxyltransferase subunit alpha [Clostridiales bacterium]|jgi:acetyl-CoA carboxylase carboxyl transferase alpha subunit|nr:acetyl-CoA carboxylase carboxyltransferase subunit alpha [Clostridiales bacterium]